MRTVTTPLSHSIDTLFKLSFFFFKENITLKINKDDNIIVYYG